MASAAGTKPTLEALVARYRREAGAQGPQGGAPELEVRLQGVDHANFVAIYEGLAAEAPGELTQVVSVLVDVPLRGEGTARHLRAARVREIYFRDGQRERERVVLKEPLLPPFRARGPGLEYAVALSLETPVAERPVSDEKSVVRVKARVSFLLAVPGAEGAPLPWRADLTVTRQLAGGEAAAPGGGGGPSQLAEVVGAMFRRTPPLTPATLLRALGLAGEAPERARYRYEVEVEFAGAGAQRDAVRPADVGAAAAAVLRHASPESLQEGALQALVHRAAQHMGLAGGLLARFAPGAPRPLGLKQLLPQARALTREDYRELFPPRGYYLTDKADGRRALGFALDSRGALAADTLHEFAPPGPPEKGGVTIADGELVEGEGGALAFYVFDAITVAGDDLAARPFEARLERLEEAAARLRAAGVPAQVKGYRHLAAGEAAALERDVRAVFERPRPYEVDGLILVGPGRPYADTPNLKWKGEYTIDFLARRAPAAARGAPPFADRPGHQLHFFFVGASAQLAGALGLLPCPGYAELFPGGAGGGGDYAPVQFAPSGTPLAYLYQHPDDSPLGPIDGRIVEARADVASAEGGRLAAWEVTQVRADRQREVGRGAYWGNDFRVAELNWLNYVNPLPLAELWTGPGADYFRQEKAGFYRAPTAAISFLKSQRIASFSHAAWVLDLAAGRGADLGRYLAAQVRNLVAVDADRAALATLVQRKYSYAARAASGPPSAAARRGPRPGGGTTVHILLADLAAPFGGTLERLAALGLRAGGADAVVCNNAVHYFLGSLEGLRNFVELARGAVRPGGAVVVTALFGEAVHALFAAEGVGPGQAWEAREGGAVKYALHRRYESEALEAVGQRIGVLLPFSAGELYEEFLVNTAALAAEFAARGLRLAHRASAADSLADFGARSSLAAELTPDDRRYLGLLGELVFVRDE